MSTKSVFVIMPFTSSPTRDEQALTSFFEHNIKKPIEDMRLEGTAFVVRRSDDRFDITKSIILDLHNADIVVCDLSGEYANPNVMYELGVRLSISNRPVILIREKSPQNKRIFDIGSFHIKEYDPLRYHELETFLVEKLRKLIASSEQFRSPVLEILSRQPSVVDEVMRADVVNRLYSALFAIRSIKRIFAASVAHIASQVEGASFSNDVDAFPEEFNSQTEVLDKANWSTLRIVLRPHPAIDALITQPPTHQLMPPHLLSLLKTFVLEFWTVFFSTDAFIQNMTMDKIAILFSEMNRAEFLLQGAIDFLQERIDEHILGKLYSKVLKDSVLVGEFVDAATE